MPSSPCGPGGGKRADVLGMDVKYSSPGSSAPVFNIPAGTKSVSVYISSETGITSGEKDYAQGDEDFITISAIIDIASNTSSGYVNYAKNTFTDGSGTNVYGWQNVPLGAFIPTGSKVGDATPDLNNVSFTISGTTLTIAQMQTGIHSSYYVQYLSPYTNSLTPLDQQVKALLHGTATANTDLLVPIPAGTDIIFISGKGTNSSYADLKTGDGTEEGYANFRFTVDLDKARTDGFVTLANGGSANRRSTYVVSNLSTTYTGTLIGSGVEDGDYTGKSINPGAVGRYNPNVYISGGNLVIKRDASYARDFDDAYVVEFYKRTGQGMSAEFVNSDFQFIPKGFSSAAGVSRTFTIPPGTNTIYFNETGNAVNVDRESNENSLEAYAYIDLNNETASGYFYQQVGLSLTQRRDDNYAFKGVPLDNSSTRAHTGTVGFKGPNNYDISFSLSADKSKLTVTTKTELAPRDYQFLLSADYYGSKPDIAFNASAITFEKVTPYKTVKANVSVCNPGAGNSNGGMPVSFYYGDPRVNPSAKLLYTGSFNEGIQAGECKQFSFDIDLSSFSNLDIDLTIIINDDGSFVPGGVGHTVGTTFTLDALATQHATYQECYYGNNLVTKPINVNNAPEVDPDPDNSSGATGAYSYLDYFNAGSSTGANIADADLAIIDPDASDLHSATVTLTNAPDAAAEGLYVEGTLPAGITASGSGSGVISLSGQASQADYIAALKMIVYRNSKGSPNTDNRIITAVVNDGIEDGPPSTTTIIILTNPHINVTGNSNTIADNSTAVTAADGTDFGMLSAAAVAHTFSISNIGTGTLTLTASPAVSISGDAGFTISLQPAISTIPVTDNATFEVRFNPAGHGAGTFTAVVHIANNDADAGRSDYTFTVSATVNNLPVVNNSSVSGEEDHTLTFTAADFTNAYSDADGTVLSSIQIINLPANGSLNLNGAAITVGQEIPFSQLGNITFVPAADWNGSTGFDWNASDGMSYAAAAAHMNITITPVNDAPHITLPAGLAVTEDIPAGLAGISFDDIDAAAGAVTATFTTTSGTLSAASGNGVTVSGTPSAIILNGTLADINAFLAAGNLIYTTTQNPPATLQIVVNISDNGNTGTGGALQDTKQLTLNITAVNDAPTGTGDTKVTPEDTPVSGAVTGADVDGDVLSFTKATAPTHGSVVVNNDGSYVYTPAADYHGPDNFDVAISDGNGGSVTVTVNITVTPVNDAPTGTGDTKVTPEDTPVSGAVTGADVDGDVLHFAKTTDPAHGSVFVNNDGSYTYTPGPDYHGPDNFDIVITDGNGGSVTVAVNITVTPVNDGPTGTGDTKVTPEDTPVSGAVTGADVDNDVLTFTKATDPAHGSVVVNGDGSYTYTPAADYHGPDNFDVAISDGNGGSVTVTVNIAVTPVNDAPTGTGDAKVTPEDTPVSGAVTGADIDNDVLTFTKAKDPAHGSVVLNNDGSYTYTPGPDYHGPDNFDIVITDGNGGSVTVAVNITVTPVNDGPTGTGDTKVTPEDTPVSGAVTGADVDNDVLSFTKATDPAHGSVVVNNDGSYTYTPAANYHGPDNFDVTIADGNGGSVIVSVNITVTPVNDAPTGTGDTKVTPEDTPVSGGVTGADIDNDVLTFTKATDPAHGTAIVNRDGSYTYTPSANYNGPDSFTITISDGNGGTVTVAVDITVTPVNDLPAGTGDNQTTPKNTPVTSAVTGTDADGDPLTYTKATRPAHGVATVNSNGTYTYAPVSNYTGPDSFTITISDGNGGTATVTVNITVIPVNAVPIGTGDTKTTKENTPVSGTVTGTDPDGDALTFARQTNPAHGTIQVNPDGTYSYMPATGYHGPDSFTITISDGNGGTATVVVNITVIPVIANPAITLVKSGVLGSDNSSITYSFTVTNTGTVALYNITVTDNMLGLNETIPGPLQPGASATISAIYHLTQADRDKGSVSNTAVVKAQTSKGIEVKDASGTRPDNDDPTQTTVPGRPRAFNDEADTNAGEPVNIAVLNNDDAAHAAFNPESVTIMRQPQNGTLIVNSDGTVTYTPGSSFSGDDSFAYQVQDVAGYQTNVAFVVVHVHPGDLIIPTLFTPNGDGKNDVFRIGGLERYPENELVVVNRWGNEVYRQKNYQDNWRGDGLNEGTYYYVLRVKKPNGSWQALTGYTTLIRKFKQ